MYDNGQSDEGRVTIGDIAGELLRQVVTTPPSSDRPKGQDSGPAEESSTSRPTPGDTPGPGGPQE